MHSSPRYSAKDFHKGEIEGFYLPFYSPELNPDEYLNGNLKNKVHSGTPIRLVGPENQSIFLI